MFLTIKNPGWQWRYSQSWEPASQASKPVTETSTVKPGQSWRDDAKHQKWTTNIRYSTIWETATWGMCGRFYSTSQTIKGNMSEAVSADVSPVEELNHFRLLLWAHDPQHQPTQLAWTLSEKSVEVCKAKKSCRTRQGTGKSTEGLC